MRDHGYIQIILLLICCGFVTGVGAAAVPQLRAHEVPGALTMLLPAGWNIDNFQCLGISVTNPQDPTYGIMFLSQMHQYPYLLPYGTTPEQYVENYFSQDLALGGKVADSVRIVQYLDIDVSAISSFGGINVKPMEVSLRINGVPVIAYLTVGTYDIYVGTVVAYLWGFYGPAATIAEDGPVMKQVFDSIRYDQDYMAECRRLMKWG
ncbi:hypothetical protein [Methanospirillum hungatei]|uniref:hypothetical protein n=1 Tax=Methanospirillum hungatei TaxID=2203 RepID=UPI0026E9E9CC|nr:hypothetical protein [Methanospirillum hungatei]MCA1916139.1 hypothetical protein [Methanospirillum hungatei]